MDSHPDKTRNKATGTEKNSDQWHDSLLDPEHTELITDPDNPLSARTPKELTGLLVIGTDSEVLGRIKRIVASKTRDDAYAVVTHGGLMGLGAHEFLIPLNELRQLTKTKVQAEFNASVAEERPEFDSRRYRVMDSDKPIYAQSYLNR